MEHMSESLQRAAFTISAADPYALAHELVHWASRFGRVIERENHLFTSGPETSSRIRFDVEKELDKFTYMRVYFDLSGDMNKSSLSVVIESTLECSLPNTRGLATDTFRQFYLSRLWPAHLRLVQTLAAEILENARHHVFAATAVAGV